MDPAILTHIGPPRNVILIPQIWSAGEWIYDDLWTNSARWNNMNEATTMIHNGQSMKCPLNWAPNWRSVPPFASHKEFVPWLQLRHSLYPQRGRAARSRSSFLAFWDPVPVYNISCRNLLWVEPEGLIAVGVQWPSNFQGQTLNAAATAAGRSRENHSVQCHM